MPADDYTPSTHDWHVGTDGLELLIRRDEADSLAMSLGHENIDDKHVTTIVATRLVEMIESVAPDAFEYHDARVRAEAAKDAAKGLTELVRAIQSSESPNPIDWQTGALYTRDCLLIIADTITQEDTP